MVGGTGATAPTAEGHTGRRSRRTSTPAFVAFTRRILRALERRADDVDPEALAELVGLQADLESVIESVVRKLRWDEDYPASWATIGDAFGTTRQAAQKRWGYLGGARVAGGQQGSLR